MDRKLVDHKQYLQFEARRSQPWTGVWVLLGLLIECLVFLLTTWWVVLDCGEWLQDIDLVMYVL